MGGSQKNWESMRKDGDKPVFAAKMEWCFILVKLDFEYWSRLLVGVRTQSEVLKEKIKHSPDNRS